MTAVSASRLPLDPFRRATKESAEATLQWLRTKDAPVRACVMGMLLLKATARSITPAERLIQTTLWREAGAQTRAAAKRIGTAIHGAFEEEREALHPELQGLADFHNRVDLATALEDGHIFALGGLVELSQQALAGDPWRTLKTQLKGE